MFHLFELSTDSFFFFEVGLHIWNPIVRHYKKLDECTSLSSFIHSVHISAESTY